ncbi:MAG: endo-1,4-beta-xylanase [Clostridium sp.]|jgi:endo-1,4-beta-xylanase|nr:endo-1,4-beta-xylanase [Clostridium sp.]
MVITMDRKETTGSEEMRCKGGSEGSGKTGGGRNRKLAAVLLAVLAAVLGACGSAAAPEEEAVAVQTSAVLEGAAGETAPETPAGEAAQEEAGSREQPGFETYPSLARLLEPYGIVFGTVINYGNMRDERFLELAKGHFNSLTTANEMKAYSLLDQSASQKSGDGMPAMNYGPADEILAFAQENGIGVRGHALVWDAYMTDWFFREDYDADKGYADQDTLRRRLESYITQVVTHFETNYPGVVYCWDVVNEAVGDGADSYVQGDLRHIRAKRDGKDNPFYALVGEDYTELAFLYARDAVEALQAADPSVDIRLIYNDYNAFYPDKRAAICALVESINSYAEDEDGTARRLCDGVGMQSYIGGYGTQNGCMNFGDIEKIRTAVEAYAALGMEVHATEMAVRNYEAGEPYAGVHARFYRQLFEMYVSLNQDGNGPLTGISIWGLIDRPNLSRSDYSYLMNGPYCGLFTEDYAVKESFLEIYELLSQQGTVTE